MGYVVGCDAGLATGEKVLVIPRRPVGRLPSLASIARHILLSSVDTEEWVARSHLT